MHSHADDGLLADDDAVYVIGVNVDRITQAMAGLDLPAMGAFALWIPNERVLAEPVVISVCSSEVWAQRLAPLVATPDADQMAVALDPQSWDHPEVELPDPWDRAGFEEASGRLLERFVEERDPVAGVLDETARRAALAPPVPTNPMFVAMATDGAAKSDEVLASLRYASPAAGFAALEARGLPKSWWDL
jgi:hypothetical protein